MQYLLLLLCALFGDGASWDTTMADRVSYRQILRGHGGMAQLPEGDWTIAIRRCEIRPPGSRRVDLHTQAPIGSSITVNICCTLL